MILPISEMTSRARDVFRMVVENYLDNGGPVASRTIARFGGLNLSPASIRNVMQDLEELGLLAAPHTSAGRMPTELGLRLFVDGKRVAATTADVSDPGQVDELVAALLTGRESAWRKFHQRYDRLIYRCITRVTAGTVLRPQPPVAAAAAAIEIGRAHV